MNPLFYVRMLAIVGLAVGGVTMGYAVANRDESLYLTAAAVCFGGLATFLGTEAFGRIARGRSRLSRWVARVFLLPCCLIAAAAIFALVQAGLRNGGA